MSCSVLTELPTDILLNNILRNLDAPSLTQLSLTSRLFSQLCQDELLWKHLVLEDFHIPLDASFRQMGWKNLYMRLNDSRVYTWGENADSRLGHTDRDLGTRLFFNSRAVSTPHELTSLRGKNIVDIVAGGWSFHALDKHGRVWMWGTLQKEANRSRSMGSRLVREPSLVAFPENTHIVSISAGRSHAIALAQDGTVWHWSNIWTPQRVHLPSSLQNKVVVQVSANWGRSSILTENGELVVIPLPAMVSPAEPSASTDLILDDNVPVITLNSLRQDDELHRSYQQSSTNLLARPVLKDDFIVQIAGMEHDTLALSRFGRVYKVDCSSADMSRAPTSYVLEYIHFGAAQQEDNQRNHLHRFISASFHSFAVYTLDGQVLLGKHDDPFDQHPQILNHQGICKVSFGDYHCGALTNQGDLLTWGAFSAGALGHGETEDMEEHHLESPTKVQAFQDMYVFAIGFGGWHSGVLAIPKN
ncbi:regulator of chromosome condensation 1/beta-lactamase-inhibitor protein II [Halteromyces radiatus]|uniref:regulator of chromosome condensation 1/beta-lactamase-inhibitor protein II n=1 Tax=Halteromyces radiatus TaxID=101107 RepID=UPI00221E3A47|nr:regulator of chromosome condensation 1/beta-lactamase-inhibitor protein II [Halteromyces radiatus]KAI8088990.1 regulator of chromosome condensation 1/beta-lactamase-inhibitor protein II [Halteromyces radiatus]